jgi:hypothetical protein
MTQSLQNPSRPTTTPRISIAIATYNGEKFIREQLDSIARQTLPPAEIVITDDGSTDTTLKLIDDFSSDVPFPVRIFRNASRLGYADNFLRAASLCTGDIIAFSDQDDIWLDNKLATCARLFSDPGVVLVAHSAWVWVESGERTHRRPFYRKTQILQPASTDPFGFPLGFAMLIRRSLLQITTPAHRPHKIAGHDQWFWLLAASIGKIATIAEPLVLYRQHQGNVFGAGKRAGTGSQARNIVRTTDYEKLADTELDCSNALFEIAEQNPQFAGSLQATARMIARRSQLHRTRTAIYRKDSTLFGRTILFARIFIRKGYMPDSSGTSLGPRAAMKDLLFGVPGIFKLSDDEAFSNN